VIFDVVYNHAGGGFDPHSMWFFDRAPTADNTTVSTSPTRVGPADWCSLTGMNDVKQYLIDMPDFSMRIPDRRLRLRRSERDGPVRRWATCQDSPAPWHRKARGDPESPSIGLSIAGLCEHRADGAPALTHLEPTACATACARRSQAHRTARARSVSMTAIAGAIERHGLHDRWRAVQIDREPRPRLCRPAT